MSDTFRNINKVSKAGQKDLWNRPNNPKQTAKKSKDRDTK